MMKDIEFEVYTALANLLHLHFPGIDVSSDFSRSPSEFPHVSIEQSDAPLVPERQDTKGEANYWRVVFTVEIYSNRLGSKKRECKEIAGVIDDWMIAHNFTRLILAPMDYLNDASIFRMVGRYQASTDGSMFYRR